MTSLMRRLDAALFPIAPPERLAMLRVLCGSFALGYIVIRNRAFLSLAGADPSRFEAVGVLSSLGSPVSDGVLVGCFVAAVLAGIGFVTGVGFRLSGPLFALLLLALSTYRSSWGQILWLENVMVLQVLIVGFARSADALAWRPGARAPSANKRAGQVYGVPVRLAAFVTVATYLLSALAKFRLGGTAWMLSDSLRNHVAGSVARAELLNAPASPVGRWLVAYDWVFPPMAVASVVLELASPIALVKGRLRDVWVASAWLMHVSIAVLMYVVFPYPLFLVAFAPFYDLERLTTIRWRPSTTTFESPRSMTPAVTSTVAAPSTQGGPMSVIVIGRMTVDPGNVEKLWAERKADFEAIAKAAKAAGGIHHRWCFGDDHVVIVDEWTSGEAFQKFFDSQPQIGELMQAAGVQGPPEFDILRAQDGPDQF